MTEKNRDTESERETVIEREKSSKSRARAIRRDYKDALNLPPRRRISRFGLRDLLPLNLVSALLSSISRLDGNSIMFVSVGFLQ